MGAVGPRAGRMKHAIAWIEGEGGTRHGDTLVLLRGIMCRRAFPEIITPHPRQATLPTEPGCAFPRAGSRIHGLSRPVAVQGVLHDRSPLVSSIIGRPAPCPTPRGTHHRCRGHRQGTSYLPKERRSRQLEGVPRRPIRLVSIVPSQPPGGIVMHLPPAVLLGDDCPGSRKDEVQRGRCGRPETRRDRWIAAADGKELRSLKHASEAPDTHRMSLAMQHRVSLLPQRPWAICLA